MCVRNSVPFILLLVYACRERRIGNRVRKWEIPVFPYVPGEHIDPLHAVPPALALVRTREQI